MFPERAKSVMRFLDCPCEYFPRGTEISAVENAYSSALSEGAPLLIVIEGHMLFDGGERSADFRKKVFAAPPVREEAALELAREHFAFCPDNVLQNTETTGRLADELTKSTVWHFWWD